MYCKYCGQPVMENTNFCNNCGQPLDASCRKRKQVSRAGTRLNGPVLSILLFYPLWTGILTPLLHWTMRNITELCDLYRYHYISSGTSRISEVYWTSLSSIYPGPLYLIMLLLLLWAGGAGTVILLIRKGRICPEAITWQDGIMIGVLTLLPAVTRCLGYLLWARHVGSDFLWGGIYGMGRELLFCLPYLCYWLLAALLMTARSGHLRLKGIHIAAIAILLFIWSAAGNLLSSLLTASLSQSLAVCCIIYIRVSALFLWLRGAFYVVLAYWTGRGRISLIGGLFSVGVTAASALLLGPIFIFLFHYGAAGGAMCVSLSHIPGILALFLMAAKHKNGQRS